MNPYQPQAARQNPLIYHGTNLDDFRFVDLLTTSLVYFAKQIQLVNAFPWG